MIWGRSETIALAKTTCTLCHGYGLRPGRYERDTPCNCVFRAVFRACYARFRELATQEKYLSRVSLEFGHRRENRMTYGRKNEEYLADFYLISRRSLNDFEFDIFRYHFVLGADWKLCCWRMKIDRGTFFHSIYRIEQKLGRIFRDLEPYSLYPLDEYFHGTIRKVPAVLVPIRPSQSVLHPPLQLTA